MRNADHDQLSFLESEEPETGATTETPFFFGAKFYPHCPGVKSMDDTTAKAALDIEGRATTLRNKVMAILSHHPLTADECAEKMGESILSIRPRLSELRLVGKIVATGERRKNASGKSAIVWQVTIQGDGQERRP